MTALLTDARALLGRSLDEVRQVLGADAEAIPGDEYGRLEEVTSIENDEVLPATVYLRDDRVELLYISGDALGDLRPADLAAQVGGEPIALRSRAGKQATLWVHAAEGVAYSEQGGSIDFLEVFLPRSQAAYEAEIYREPAAFIR